MSVCWPNRCASRPACPSWLLTSAAPEPRSATSWTSSFLGCCSCTRTSSRSPSAATTSVPTTRRFAADVEELTAGLPAGTLVADVPYFMHGRWEDDADQAAETVTKRARAHQLRIVPLHRALRDRGAIAMLTDFAADWFHPNDRGHRVWADALWTELKMSPALTTKRARLALAKAR